LKQAGHAVTAAARSEANRAALAALGAEARTCDLLSPPSVEEVVAGCDAVLHLATAIPEKGRRRAAWIPNDRIRREGTTALVGAAVKHRCRLYLQQSVTFLYGDNAGAWVDEDTPIAAKQRAIIESAADMEQVVARAVSDHRLAACVLRCGAFYAEDSKQTRDLVRLIDRGWFRVPGDGAMATSLIHIDDAASAFTAAVQRAERTPFRGEILNVVDDAPVTMRELGDGIAELLGRPPPKRVMRFFARLALGKNVYETLMCSTRVRNGRAKELLGWRPSFPTFREGYRSFIPIKGA
jgi:nucleoside-diphosphate-sugar epimerase